MKTLLLVLAFSLISTSKSPSTLGIYDNFYSRSDWSWYKDSGSRALLLKHNTIKDCFIAVNMEPLGYEVGDWNLKDTLEDFNKTKYRVIKVEFEGELWCYTFVPLDTFVMEQLNVYMNDSCDACLKAAKKIILKKEKFK